MDENKKKNYNKTHYLKNREKLLEKAKIRKKQITNANVVTLFNSARTRGENQPDLTEKEDTQQISVVPKTSISSVQEEESKSAAKFNKFLWVNIFLCFLVGGMTYFLMTEMATFFMTVDGNNMEAYFKALILEGAVIALSLIRPRTALLGFGCKVMVLCIYAYSIWAVSGAIIRSSFQAQEVYQLNQKLVQELETEISKKETLRDRYFKIDRVTLAKQIDRALEGIKQKLDHIRQSKVKTPNPSMIWNTLITLVIFRILIMGSNWVCIQELIYRYRLKNQSET